MDKFVDEKTKKEEAESKFNEGLINIKTELLDMTKSFENEKNEEVTQMEQQIITFKNEIQELNYLLDNTKGNESKIHKLRSKNDALKEEITHLNEELDKL